MSRNGYKPKDFFQNINRTFSWVNSILPEPSFGDQVNPERSPPLTMRRRGGGGGDTFASREGISHYI